MEFCTVCWLIVFASAAAAFATLGYHPSGDLLDRLGHHAAGIIRTFRPQATSNALW